MMSRSKEEGGTNFNVTMFEGLSKTVSQRGREIKKTFNFCEVTFERILMSIAGLVIMLVANVNAKPGWVWR